MQLAVIKSVLNGKNVVVCSPTASGKTEAIVAPVIERILAEPLDGIKVLYLTPTRALANDLMARLEQPVSDSGLSIADKTGDHPTFRTQDPSNMIVTTPESLDSIICRHADLLSRVRVVILDELHLIDNTYRGDQVRVLLVRLRKLTKEDFKVHIMSATIHDPREIASRYSSSYEVIVVPGQRDIEYLPMSGQNISTGLQEMVKELQNRGRNKVLCFCNSRKETEALGRMLKNIVGEEFVAVHHARLSRSMRLQAEQALKTAQRFYCVATSTLEVGIDIGDIDAIVLYKPPRALSSLLQRIGRGNRRKEETFAVALYTSPAELQIFESMFNMVKKGVLEQRDYVPSKSAWIQQILSILYQQRYNGISNQDIYQYVRVLGLDMQSLNLITGHLIEENLVQETRGLLHPAARLMDMAEHGWIHSNVPSGNDVDVFDTDGNSVGSIAADLNQGSRFILGGKVWIVARAMKGKVFVKTATGEGGALPVFGYDFKEGSFYHLLPKELRNN